MECPHMKQTSLRLALFSCMFPQSNPKRFSLWVLELQVSIQEISLHPVHDHVHQAVPKTRNFEREASFFSGISGLNVSGFGPHVREDVACAHSAYVIFTE